MDIANLSMNMAQSNAMSQISTGVLAMSLDNINTAGANIANMISEVPVNVPANTPGVMSADHIDMLA